MKEQTFQPYRGPIQRMKSNLQTLGTAIRQILFNLDFREFMEKERANYQSDPVRQSLLSFERFILQLREDVAKNKVSPNVLRDDLREWVGYSRSVFFRQLYLLYYTRGFYLDAKRVLATEQKGTPIKTDVKDERGRVIGTETMSEDKEHPLTIELSHNRRQ